MASGRWPADHEVTRRFLALRRDALTTGYCPLPTTWGSQNGLTLRAPRYSLAPHSRPPASPFRPRTASASRGVHGRTPPSRRLESSLFGEADGSVEARRDLLGGSLATIRVATARPPPRSRRLPRCLQPDAGLEIRDRRPDLDLSNTGGPGTDCHQLAPGVWRAREAECCSLSSGDHARSGEALPVRRRSCAGRPFASWAGLAAALDLNGTGETATD